jgi:hypothetical protein
MRTAGRFVVEAHPRSTTLHIYDVERCEDTAEVEAAITTGMFVGTDELVLRDMEYQEIAREHPNLGDLPPPHERILVSGRPDIWDMRWKESVPKKGGN